ncbi:MAG: HAMP domain-containing sensor histidine kinase [bacterium]|nr:HAMP domain-containing sensor histidine kinase [bacterium]
MKNKIKKSKGLTNDAIAILAHQLQTPLATIRWAFESLDKEKLTSDQKEIVQAGLATSQRLVQTTESLLNLAKIEAGKLTYQFERLDVGALLVSICDGVSLYARKHKVRIQLPSIQRMVVRADKEKLRLAFTNLIENAIKYNKNNGIVMITFNDDGKKARINISDTGIGIPKDAQKKLFTQFFRADNVGDREKGVGLGLYIVKRIIGEHGGSITLASEPNKGTTFHVVLPL